jgi:hypothetical protein
MVGDDGTHLHCRHLALVLRYTCQDRSNSSDHPTVRPSPTERTEFTMPGRTGSSRCQEADRAILLDGADSIFMAGIAR